MVSFFTTTLLLSIVAITALFILKQIELSTGSVILAGMRPRANRFFKTCLVIVERVIPGLAKEGAWHVLMRGRDAVKKLLAHGILKLETTLHSILQFIREKIHPSHARGEASPFLKEVGEYKKQLEAENKEDRAIFDESITQKME